MQKSLQDNPITTTMTNDEIEYTGEDNPGEDNLESIEANSKDKQKELRKKLDRCEKEKLNILEDLQRAKADFLNSRKRLEDDQAATKERLKVDYIEKLLPLYDSFSMAMSNETAWQAVDDNWRVGVESIYGQLLSILKELQAFEINPLGEEFDPEKHEAVSNVTVETKDDGKVISVVQKGFVFKNDQKEILVRPARVTVGEAK